MRPNPFNYFDNHALVLCDHCRSAIKRLVPGVLMGAGSHDFCGEYCAIQHAIQIDLEEILDAPLREAIASSKE